jgi:hypothetical protein
LTQKNNLRKSVKICGQNGEKSKNPNQITDMNKRMTLIFIDFNLSTLSMTKEGLMMTNSIVRDCFGRASLAMTNTRVMTSECLTTTNTVPSLRGTKQSRNMKKDETYHKEGCKLIAGILDCFGRSSLAMTTGGGQQSCSSSNPVNYLRCFPLRFRSDSDNFAMTKAWGTTILLIL